MLSALIDAVLDGLALILPVECAGCGAPDRAVCAACAARLVPEPSSRRLADGLTVFSGLEYEGIARAVILAFKEQSRTGLARPLAPALAAAVAAASASFDLAGVELVAVPSSRRSRRRRGFDPVPVLIARAGLDRSRVFAPARPHAVQKSLTVDERARNLAAVFETRTPLSGRRFVLVDDVVTSGATLTAAANALRAAGAEVVAAVVVASTPRRFAPLSGFVANVQ
ncbi:ComF family protein [Lysinimonas soli]|uniref:ComF family protein n=1 Tax=Lysinimonas soli TaxID=1074233 RepID=A0ABW0NTD1_9MICO